MDILNVCIHRHEFIKQQVVGTILDVGCREGSIWIPQTYSSHAPTNISPDRLTFFDLDCWNITWCDNPKFVRGNANSLPFEDNSFNTVVLGDILEHIVTPDITLLEAFRVAKDKVVVTVPDEYHWGKGLNPFGKPESEKEDYEKEMINNTIESDKTYATCTDFVDDRELKHLYHINHFNEELILSLLKSFTSQLETGTKFSYGLIRIWSFFDPNKVDTLGANYALIINKLKQQEQEVQAS